MLKKEEGKTQDTGLMRTWAPMENAKVALHWQCVSNWTTCQMLQNIFDWLCYSISMRSNMMPLPLLGSGNRQSGAAFIASCEDKDVWHYGIWSIWDCIITECLGQVGKRKGMWPGWKWIFSQIIPFFLDGMALLGHQWPQQQQHQLAELHKFTFSTTTCGIEFYWGKKGFLPNQTITNLYSTCCLGLLCLKMRAGVQVFIRLKNQINFHVLFCCNKYPYRKEVTIW